MTACAPSSSAAASTFARVVDERREEVEREDDRAVVVQPVHGRIVRWREADEQILRLRRDEAGEEPLEPGRGVLRSTAAAGGQIGELHARRGGFHPLNLAPPGNPAAAARAAAA